MELRSNNKEEMKFEASVEKIIDGAFHTTL